MKEYPAAPGQLHAPCSDLPRLLEVALGEVTGERFTAEFHQTQASQQQKTETR